jgi:hypothetical protein
MKLSQITAEPKLVQVSLDDKDTVKEYGEPLVFYTWDRQPMDIFMRLANSDGNNPAGVIDVVKNLILDENGKPILNDKAMLPTVVMMKAITKVTEQLGK